MYCEKLQSICQNTESPKFLIDERVIYKLDSYLKNHVTLRERQNLNPVKFAIDMNVNYKTSLMTFIIGARVQLFQIRTFFNCTECDEQQELTTLDQIYCECGIEGTYQELKDQVTLYFKLLERPQPCYTHEEIENELDLLNELDIEQINNVSLSDVEKVGGSAILQEVVTFSSIGTRREEKMKKYLGE